MACPKCKCKETHHYDDTWDGEPTANDDMECCAHCGHIFYLDDALDEDDEPEYLEIPVFLRRDID